MGVPAEARLRSIGAIRATGGWGSLPAEAQSAKAGAVSSVVEHRLYTPAVTGSNPVPPTRTEVQRSKFEV